MDAFDALADRVRREILQALVDGPARVVDLAAALPISRPAVSKHLRLLTEAGLATVEDRGRERHYALARSGLTPVRTLLDALLETPRPTAPFADAHLDGLEMEVRRTVRDRRTTADPTHQEETA